MQHHNAPIWAKLEDECLEAAKALGTTVAVISGPVYAPDPTLPPPGNKLLHTSGMRQMFLSEPVPFDEILAILCEAEAELNNS